MIDDQALYLGSSMVNFGSLQSSFADGWNAVSALYVLCIIMEAALHRCCVLC
jgi:hypothetical protein